MEGDARQIASAADESANSRSLFVLWRFSSEVVGATGFEPATPCAQGRCATRLRYAPTLGHYHMLEWRRGRKQRVARDRSSAQRFSRHGGKRLHAPHIDRRDAANE